MKDTKHTEKLCTLLTKTYNLSSYYYYAYGHNCPCQNVILGVKDYLVSK